MGIPWKQMDSKLTTMSINYSYLRINRRLSFVTFINVYACLIGIKKYELIPRFVMPSVNWVTAMLNALDLKRCKDLQLNPQLEATSKDGTKHKARHENMFFPALISSWLMCFFHQMTSFKMADGIQQNIGAVRASLTTCRLTFLYSLQWGHTECIGVSNHRRLDCLLSRLSRRISKKTSKLRVTVRGIRRGSVDSPHKGPVTRKMFHLMTSSWVICVNHLGPFLSMAEQGHSQWGKTLHVPFCFG